jgi:hypothetical protein
MSYQPSRSVILIVQEQDCTPIENDKYYENYKSKLVICKEN